MTQPRRDRPEAIPLGSPNRFRRIALALALLSATPLTPAWPAPKCPLSYGTTDAAKSHKLFLYFPTADDSTFPAYDTGVSPARLFDVAALDPTIGTTAALRDRIFDVVSDDYCEFNVQVLETTTNPASLPMPPPRRVTVAVGTDVASAWGEAQEVDTGDGLDVDFARVWAGTYTTCEGGTGSGGCSMTGSLSGANSTLDRWAQAIGGTAAHEAGHTYGLAHTDDDPPTGACGEFGSGPRPGEDGFNRHLMPNGCRLTGPDRAGYRRHISDVTFGLLAQNVGLSIQTMHNWDLKNPNPGTAKSLAIDFLSTLPSVSIAWSWGGSSSPWINPVVSGPSGTTVWKGTTYNNFRITWSIPNPGWATPGSVPGGAEFHVGTTFTGVDFNQPDPIIIQNITLFDASSSPLPLHPRLPMYDAGTLDAADGAFALHFFSPPAGPPLVLQDAIVYQLPRVASIESMTGDGRPLTFEQEPIIPWSTGQCTSATPSSSRLARREGASVRCVLGKPTDRPHVLVNRRPGDPGVVPCKNGVPTASGKPAGRSTSNDSRQTPDYEGPICAGSSRDPFPSTTIYVIATFIDPKAEHYDPQQQRVVVGPVTSKVFYQFSGVREPRLLTAGRISPGKVRSPDRH